MRERVCVQIVDVSCDYYYFFVCVHNVLDTGRAVEVAFTFF